MKLLGPFLAERVSMIGQKMTYLNHRVASMELDNLSRKKKGSIRFV